MSYFHKYNLSIIKRDIRPNLSSQAVYVSKVEYWYYVYIVLKLPPLGNIQNVKSLLYTIYTMW